MLSPHASVPSAVAALSCALAAGASAGVAAETGKRSFNLPRGDAAVPLTDFAAAAGTPIVYLVDRVRGATTNAVRGELAPRDALDRMLAGSGLEAAQDAETGAFVVSRKRTGSEPVRPREVGPVSDPQPKPKTTPMNPTLTRRAAALFAGWLASIAAANAQTLAPRDEPLQLNAFVVSTQKDDGYRAANSVSGTRVDTPVRNIPISIEVVTEEFLRDFQPTDVAEAARNISGMTSEPRNNSDFANFTVRGFRTGNTLRNGVRRVGLSDTVNIQRIEVAKGPNALLYGFLDPAGAINTITKRPTPGRNGAFGVSAGSDEFLRSTLSLNQPLNRGETVLFRVDASYLEQGSHRDFADTRKRVVAPVVQVKPTPRTVWTGDFEWINVKVDRPLSPFPQFLDPATGTFFVPYLPETFNANTAGTYLKLESTTWASDLTHRFNEHFTLRHYATYFLRQRDNYMTTASTVSGAQRNLLARGVAYNDITDHNFKMVTELLTSFSFAETDFKLITGWDNEDNQLDNFNRSTSAATLGVPAAWNLLDRASWDPTLPNRDLIPLNSNVENKFGANEFYGVLQGAAFKGRLHVLGGVRSTKIDQDNTNRMAGTVVSSSVSRTTPQVGVLGRVLPWLAVYANYAESFRSLPNLRLNPDRSVSSFDPTVGKGSELGIKIDTPSGRASINANVFEIRQTGITRNVAVTDSLGQFTAQVQSGEEKGKGFEVNANANVTSQWQVLVGYSYVDAHVVSNQQSRALEGRPLPFIPSHQFTLTTRYAFAQGPLKGLSIGGSYVWVDERVAQLSTVDYIFGAYGTITLNASYNTRLFGRRTALRLNVANLSDKLYYAGDLGAAPGRQVRFGVETFF
jgi:iron complex outermembrane receptor protein